MLCILFYLHEDCRTTADMKRYCKMFFNYYLAAPRPTLGLYRGDSLTHPMLITAFLHVQPEGHWEPNSNSLVIK